MIQVRIVLGTLAYILYGWYVSGCSVVYRTLVGGWLAAVGRPMSVRQSLLSSPVSRGGGGINEVDVTNTSN